jgi:hypothetical protein
MTARIAIPIGLALTVVLCLAPSHSLAAPRTSLLVAGGYGGGPGAFLGFTVRDLAEHLPFGLRFGIGYSGADPGDPWEARRVFINANENGEPSKAGRRWDYRLDGVWRTRAGGFDRLDLVAGPRLSRFAAQFDFVGGNEFFDVTTTQWGFGGGAEAAYRMGERVDLVLGAGLDYYLDATLAGHDTSYSPDGSAVSPVEDYGWRDANHAIRQPNLTPRVMLGVQWGLGR